MDFRIVPKTIALLFGLSLLLARPAYPSPPGELLRQPERSEQRGIVVLVPDDFTRPWIQQLAEGFREVALSPASAPALYIETLDAARFGDERYVEQFREWLRQKYRDRRVDVVAPLGEEGVAFLARKGGEPWPGVPVVYTEVGDISVDTARDLPQATSVVLEDSFPSALGVIKHLLPRTTHVALVYGASMMEQRRVRLFADRVRSANLGLEPIVLGGLSLEATLEKVASLSEDTVVFILFPAVDAKGRALTPGEVCARLTEAGGHPTFMMGRHDMGCGIVGGLLRDMKIVGNLAARQALARMDGDTTSRTDVPMARYTALAFDARQLERWSIPVDRLPAGSAVLFRQSNLWHDHRGFIVTVLVVLVTQTGLIGGLVIEHRRRRRAEVEGRRHLAAMAHLDRRAVMGELTASLAHELNQPLGAILHNAEAARTLLSRENTKLEDIREIVDDIRDDDRRASEIIRRLRRLLKKQELEAKPVDVNDIARETLAFLAPDAASRGVRVALDVPDAPNIVIGDRVHLQQALLNLVLNGLEAMATIPAERRRLTVRATSNRHTVDVAVIDQGPGIPEALSSKIFEPFVTTKGEGMGMGLSIARSIVEAHGGSIAADTNQSGGATIRFSLPIRRMLQAVS